MLCFTTTRDEGKGECLIEGCNNDYKYWEKDYTKISPQKFTGNHSKAFTGISPQMESFLKRGNSHKESPSQHAKPFPKEGYRHRWKLSPEGDSLPSPLGGRRGGGREASGGVGWAWEQNKKCRTSSSLYVAKPRFIGVACFIFYAPQGALH